MNDNPLASYTCSTCARTTTSDAMFCVHCGGLMKETQPPVGDNFCGSCGHPKKPDAVFCGNCGASSDGARLSTAQIEANWRRFHKYVTATCPHCEYQGPMGYDSFYHPIPKWVWVPLMILGIVLALIPGLVIWFIAAYIKRYAPECPNCGRTLRLKTGEATPFYPPAAALAQPPSVVQAAEMMNCSGDPICPFCKEEIRPGAVKCKHCSSDLSSRAVTPQTQMLIREELRKYKSVVSMMCLECGYDGPMGLVRQIKPLWQQGWLMYLSLIGIGIPLFLFSYVFGKPLRNVVVCPACRQTLVSQNAPAENSVFFVIGR